jgi:hypothetical protein
VTDVLSRRGAVWILAIGIVALTVAAQCRTIAMPDMAFLLYGAGRVLDGAVLYRDVVEINPPLIVALNLPIVWLSRLAGISEFLLYRLATAALLGLLLWWSRSLLTRCTPLDAPARRLALLALCVALFPLAGEDYGEREQLVLGLLLPYLIVAAARLREQDAPQSEAATAGALAGVALALKPHFVLVWLAVEGYLRWRRPAARFRISAPNVALVAVLSAYALGVALLTPEYFRLAVELGPAYATYLRDPFYRLLITGPGAALILFALLAAVAARGSARHGELWGLLAAAVIGCLLAGAAQEKGLRYHFYPAFALAFVLLVIVAANARPQAVAASERIYARLSRPVAVAIVVVLLARTAVDLFGGGPASRHARAEFLDLAEFIQRHSEGRPVGVLSYHIGSAFPLVNYAGVPLASRFPHLWLFPVSYWDALHADAPLPYRAPERMGERERYFFGAVKHDLLAARPEVLLVLRPARDVLRNGLRRLHYVRYLSQDPELAAFFAGYQFAGTRGEYDVYQRVNPGAARTAPPPSAAPGVGDARLARVTEFQWGVLDAEMLAGTFVFLLVAGWSMAVRRERRNDTPTAMPSPSS